MNDQQLLLNTQEMELALYAHLTPRQGQKILVPNVSWGMFNHELDLLLLTKDGTATEIEIKISRSDLKKDQEKSHGHHSHKIKHLYFALPDYMEKDIDLVPERAGIYLISKRKFGDRIITSVVKRRNAKTYQNYTGPMETKDIIKICYLAQFRTWNTKRKLLDQQRNKKGLQLTL